MVGAGLLFSHSVAFWIPHPKFTMVYDYRLTPLLLRCGMTQNRVVR